MLGAVARLIKHAYRSSMFNRWRKRRGAMKARREDRLLSRRERRADKAASHASRVRAEANGPTQIGRGAGS